ncbi:MAG TPA: CAP domain-containing protein [Acidimicrobiia bacterium]|nr:CAP domain-containing protein [Acidimicrobiia bacterium]
MLLAIGGPLAVSRAEASETAADLTAMTNADRTKLGLRPLATANDLQSLAQQRATEMAKSGRLAHTSNLGTRVTGWKRLGENVGRGPNLRDIQTAFMASPSHRENIVDPGFTQLGVGVTWDGKEYFYVAVIFRQPSSTASAPAPTTPTTQATPPTTRAASAPPKPKPTTTTKPAPTTTAPPTTTTTLPPPPPPPVEVAGIVEPPPETTTTTAPRPVFTNPDFLAANFADPIVPVAVTKPLPGRPLTPIFLAGLLGLLVGSACTAVAMRQPAQLASELSRLRHWR